MQHCPGNFEHQGRHDETHGRSQRFQQITANILPDLVPGIDLILGEDFLRQTIAVLNCCLLCVRLCVCLCPQVKASQAIACPGSVCADSIGSQLQCRPQAEHRGDLSPTSLRPRPSLLLSVTRMYCLLIDALCILPLPSHHKRNLQGCVCGI